MTKPFMVIFLLLVLGGVCTAQTTEFKYQGSLTDGAGPANGNYDFEFVLYDALNGGNQLGATLARNGVVVTNGIFAAQLDFGNQFPGAARYLEIHVRLTGQPGFTPLIPRQSISNIPYAVKSLNADTAANATNATTATNALQLGGVAANQFVVTGDARLSDARNPLPGSTNYVQNTSTPQASSNFNISGNGTAGGTLSSNIVNATTQYNIGNGRVLSAAGFRNVFTGLGTGTGNTGSNNSFFGTGAGTTNTTGGNNTIIGTDANVGSGALNGATAIGTGAIVNASNTVTLGRAADTVQVPGALNVTGSARITNGSLFISNPNTVIITSPNGACWGITVNNSGALSTFSTACP